MKKEMEFGEGFKTIEPLFQKDFLYKKRAIKLVLFSPLSGWWHIGRGVLNFSSGDMRILALGLLLFLWSTQEDR